MHKTGASSHYSGWGRGKNRSSTFLCSCIFIVHIFLKKSYPLQFTFHNLVLFHTSRSFTDVAWCHENVLSALKNCYFNWLLKNEQNNFVIIILVLSSFFEGIAYLRLIQDERKITPQFWLLTWDFSKVTMKFVIGLMEWSYLHP